jgi:hemerythrin-like domain-containing protein
MTAAQPIDVRDMAIVHQTFRRAFSESAELVRANPTPSPERVEFLAEHVDFAVSVLHHHHASEDELLYPLLAQRAPEQVEMVNRIEAQHKTVEGTIDAVTAACAAWRSAPSAATGEALAASLDELNETLQPHLDDEEQLIVPLAAVTVTQKEWDDMGDHSVAAIPKKKLPVAFGLLTEPLNESDSAHMKATLPPPIRLLYPVLIGRPWKKYADTLRNGR